MIWLSHGGKAPSAKCSNDLALYELCLDLSMAPDDIRKMNTRDRNHLVLVSQARKVAKRQIALKNKIDATYLIDL